TDISGASVANGTPSPPPTTQSAPSGAASKSTTDERGPGLVNGVALPRSGLRSVTALSFFRYGSEKRGLQYRSRPPTTTSPVLATTTFGIRRSRALQTASGAVAPAGSRRTTPSRTVVPGVVPTKLSSAT